MLSHIFSQFPWSPHLSPHLVSPWRSEVMFDEPLLLHVVLVRGRSLGEKDLGVAFWGLQFCIKDLPYRMVPPSDVCGFINPMKTIVISAINHSYGTYKPT